MIAVWARFMVFGLRSLFALIRVGSCDSGEFWLLMSFEVFVSVVAVICVAEDFMDCCGRRRKRKGDLEVVGSRVGEAVLRGL